MVLPTLPGAGGGWSEPDELLMLLIVPVDNYTTNKNGQGGGKGQPGLMERSLANFMGLRQQALGYQFA